MTTTLIDCFAEKCACSMVNFLVVANEMAVTRAAAPASAAALVATAIENSC